MNLYEELTNHHSRSNLDLKMVKDKWDFIKAIRDPGISSLQTVMIEAAHAAAILIQFGDITGKLNSSKVQAFISTAMDFRDALASKCKQGKVQSSLVYAIQNSRVVERVEAPPTIPPFPMTDLELATMAEMEREPEVQF